MNEYGVETSNGYVKINADSFSVGDYGHVRFIRRVETPVGSGVRPLEDVAVFSDWSNVVELSSLAGRA